ncbi:MAG: hypothetical protein HKN72_16115 [Gemmatimonadetes bacterium]|nr:hypothetical protein [Gemmatimonadota bacterium]NNF14754.1 hypothetical protein [Gemmatimonadota bacterium]
MRPASEARPWLAQESWSNGSVTSEGHRQLFAHWFGAIVWNAMAVPIVLILVGEGGSDLVPFLRWVLAGFVALGVLILFNAVVYSARIARFRNLRLELDPFPGCIGGHVGGAVEIPVRPDDQTRVRATLHCIRSYIHGSGENRSRRDDVVWSAEVAPEVARSASGSRLRFGFDVPDVEQPTSEEREGDHHYWAIHLAAELPGADLDQTFVVPVYRIDPPLEASHPFIPPPDDPRELSRHGIDVEPTARGVRIVYRRGRFGGAPFGLIPFGALFVASGGFVFSQTTGAFGLGIGTAFGGIFLVAFSLVGLLLLAVGISMLVSSMTVEIQGGIVRSRRSWIFFSSTQEVPVRDLERIDAKVTMQSGQGSGARTGYTLRGTTLNGDRIPLGDGIRGAYLVDRVAAVLEAATGLRVESGVRRRLGGPPGESLEASSHEE